MSLLPEEIKEQFRAGGQTLHISEGGAAEILKLMAEHRKSLLQRPES